MNRVFLSSLLFALFALNTKTFVAGGCFKPFLPNTVHWSVLKTTLDLVGAQCERCGRLRLRRSDSADADSTSGTSTSTRTTVTDTAPWTTTSTKTITTAAWPHGEETTPPLLSSSDYSRVPVAGGENGSDVSTQMCQELIIESLKELWSLCGHYCIIARVFFCIDHMVI